MTKLSMIKQLAEVEATFIVPKRTTKSTIYSYYLIYYSHLNSLNALTDAKLKEYYDAVLGDGK